MSQIEVIDNFLSPEEFKHLQKTLTAPGFPWFVGEVLYDDEMEQDLKYNFQMYHMFYFNPNIISEAMPAIEPLYRKLNVAVFVKAKANLNAATDNHIEHGMHVDTHDEDVAKFMTTAIYYVNTNNGYTKFEDGTKVESVANRVVRFPAMTKHTGATSTDSKHRFVLNLNYIAKVDNARY